jgi:histidine ammonia-lyase
VTVVVNSRRDFTLENYRRVAVGGESVRVGGDATKAMRSARKSFVDLVESDRTAFIYGVTTGGGMGALKRLTPEEQRARAATRTARHGNAGFGGGHLPDRAVRGIVFTRLASFIEGNAKTRPEVARAVASILDGRLPRIPLDGQTYAGEIVPLAALREALPDLELEEGENLGNGSPCAAALVADVALQARNRLAIAERVFCLSIEAVSAPLEAYDPVLIDLWGDPGEARALRTINRLLAGTPKKGRRFYQAPVSWRILPRILGAAHRAVDEVEDVASVSLPSVTVNPVYELPSRSAPLGRAFSNGGYHNAMASPAMDTLNAAWSDLCTLGDHHIVKMRRSHVSLLPDGLRHEDDGVVGIGTGMVGLGHIDFVEEARHAAQRTFIPSAEGDSQNDLAEPVFLAYKKSLRSAQCIDSVMAVLAVTASQALSVTHREAPPKLRGFLAAVREQCPPIHLVGRSRPLGRELERVRDVFAEAALSGEVDLAPSRSTRSRR